MSILHYQYQKPSSYPTTKDSFQLRLWIFVYLHPTLKVSSLSFPLFLLIFYLDSLIFTFWEKWLNIVNWVCGGLGVWGFPFHFDFRTSFHGNWNLLYVWNGGGLEIWRIPNQICLTSMIEFVWTWLSYFACVCGP